MAIIWDRARFDAEYILHGYKTPWGIPNTHPKLKLHYHRGPLIKAATAQVTALLAQPGFAQVSQLVIVGGGFGWAAEAFEAAGITTIHTEIGGHILATQGTTEEGEFIDALAAAGLPTDGSYRMFGPDGTLSLDPLTHWGARNVRNVKQAVEEDLSTNGSRNAVRRQFQGNLDGILTELVLESLDDNELANFLSDVEALRPNPAANVIHLLVPDHSNPDFNSKTHQGWKDFIVGLGLDHFVVDARNYAVL